MSFVPLIAVIAMDWSERDPWERPFGVGYAVIFLLGGLGFLVIGIRRIAWRRRNGIPLDAMSWITNERTGEVAYLSERAARADPVGARQLAEVRRIQRGEVEQVRQARRLVVLWTVLFTAVVAGALVAVAAM